MEAHVRSVRMDSIQMEQLVKRVQRYIQNVQHVHKQRRRVQHVEVDIMCVVARVPHVHPRCRTVPPVLKMDHRVQRVRRIIIDQRQRHVNCVLI